MNGVDFQILKLWRDIPVLSFIEFDEKYFKFTCPEFSNNKNYAVFDDVTNLILKSHTNFQSHIWLDVQMILNKKMRN